MAGGDAYLGIDLGTGGAKAAVVAPDGRVLGTGFSPCVIDHPRPGWAEQDPDDFWAACSAAARSALDIADIAADEVAGLAFAGQMLALVPVDADGVPTRPAISWLDSRADDEAARITRRMGGAAVVRAVAGAAPSGKDIIAKVAWIRAHEPEVYKRTAVFLDATGYLVARATGALLIDHSGVSGTGLMSRRTRGWSRPLAVLGGFPLAKMPEARRSIDVAGPLRARAADLGLPAGIPVLVGMGDVPAAEVGSGAMRNGDAHLYLGTSAWLGVHQDRSPTSGRLGRNGIVTIASADPTSWLLIAESETAGACVDWFLASVGLGDDEPGDNEPGGDQLAGVAARHDALSSLVSRSPVGAGGLLFAPWLFGERAPVTDTSLRGAFVGLALGHGRADLARSVLEGVAANLAWSAGALRAAGLPIDTVRANGGGARSDIWLQIIADVLDVRVERVARPQDSGAVGCALAVAVSLGRIDSMASLRDIVGVDEVFVPNRVHRSTYDRLIDSLQEVYPALSRVSRTITGPPLVP